MAARKQNNVKRGYDLAAEALDYIADKLSSTRDDDDKLKVKSELIKRGLDVSIEDLRQKAKLLREMYNEPVNRAPPPGSRGMDDYILRMETQKSIVNPFRGLICFALGVYAHDLIETRQDIPRQVIIRKPSPEYLNAFLKMDDVDTQLALIQDAMIKDYCGKHSIL